MRLELFCCNSGRLVETPCSTAFPLPDYAFRAWPHATAAPILRGLVRVGTRYTHHNLDGLSATRFLGQALFSGVPFVAVDRGCDSGRGDRPGFVFRGSFGFGFGGQLMRIFQRRRVRACTDELGHRAYIPSMSSVDEATGSIELLPFVPFIADKTAMP